MQCIQGPQLNPYTVTRGGGVSSQCDGYKNDLITASIHAQNANMVIRLV